MATKIIFTRPGGGQGELETNLPVEGIVDQVNRALKTSEKFITITEADGKKRGLEAANVITIREVE
jgi:hypothetical protein